MEPIGLDVSGLADTDLAISCTFVVEALREDGRRLKATAHVVNGRLECRELELSAEHGRIDGGTLEKLDLASILRQAASHIADGLAGRTSDGRRSDESGVAGVIASVSRPQP